jgi:hypothetical protein
MTFIIVFVLIIVIILSIESAEKSKHGQIVSFSEEIAQFIVSGKYNPYDSSLFTLLGMIVIKLNLVLV